MRREVPTIQPVVPKRRGDAEWFAQSIEYYADNDAAQSGTIAVNEEIWMQTTVQDPGRDLRSMYDERGPETGGNEHRRR